MMIGADPELALKGREGLIGAYGFINDCWAARQETKLGYDGANATGEIRPDAQDSWMGLAGEVERVMEPILQLCSAEGVEVWAGGMPIGRQPLGGHIHFSDTDLAEYRSCPSSLTTLLDRVVGYPLTKVMATGDERCERSSYGRMGDIRRQSNEMGWFEYRTPPSWLMSPELVKAALALCWGSVEMWKKQSRDWIIECQLPWSRETSLDIIGEMMPDDILEAAHPVTELLASGDCVDECATTGWGGSVKADGGAYGSPRDKNCAKIAEGLTAGRVTYIYGLAEERGADAVWVNEDVPETDGLPLIENGVVREVARGILAIGLPAIVRQDIERAVATAQSIIDAAVNDTIYVPKGNMEVGRGDDYYLCAWCDEESCDDDGYRVLDESGEYMTVCDSCHREYTVECYRCGEDYDRECGECPECGYAEGDDLDNEDDIELPRAVAPIEIPEPTSVEPANRPDRVGEWYHIPQCSCRWCVWYRDGTGMGDGPWAYRPSRGCQDCQTHRAAYEAQALRRRLAADRERDNFGRFAPAYETSVSSSIASSNPNHIILSG